jgi:hypothetical protein
LQKELLEAYEQASRVWLARVQSEVALWSELATKLKATRSVSEALVAYTKSLSRRMQMTAEDGQRMFNDCQQITQKITKSLTNGWPTGGNNAWALCIDEDTKYVRENLWNRHALII